MIKITQDFGLGFVLAGRRPVSEKQLYDYQKGVRRDLPEKFRGCNLATFTSGDHLTVLRISRDIPTFDSGDREYDAWHDLYLIREKSGHIHAVYAAGGYRIAVLRGYAAVAAYPPELKQYFS